MIFDQARPEWRAPRAIAERAAAIYTPLELDEHTLHGRPRDPPYCAAGMRACGWRPPCRIAVVSGLAVRRPDPTARRAARNELGAMPALQPGENQLPQTKRVSMPGCCAAAMQSVRFDRHLCV